MTFDLISIQGDDLKVDLDLGVVDLGLDLSDCDLSTSLMIRSVRKTRPHFYKGPHRMQ